MHPCKPHFHCPGTVLKILATAACMAGAGVHAAELVPAANLAAASPTALPMQASDVLNGEQEVPASLSPATARSSIEIGADRAVTGAIDTRNIEGTSAHIHEGSAGANGPILVTLGKASATRWFIPPRTTLTPAQYQSFKAGNLYLDVHSAGHPNGEIRAQLRP